MTINSKEVPSIDLKHWTKVRRHFHQNPELSGEEVGTAKEVVRILKDLKIEVHDKIGGTGVLALFKTDQEGPTLMFRTELDALPIQEINEFEHRSTVEGVSHKCGHDGHLTIMLALAERLKQSPPKRGTVALLFQPAEEDGRGAKSVLEDPRFHELIKPDQVYALHNLPGYPLGETVVRKGSFTAAVNSPVYRLYGKTSHAAEPEHGDNPGLALSEMMQLALSLSRNKVDASDFSVVTPICMKLGDESYGISAGYGELHLTLRSWTQEALDSLVLKLDHGIEEIAQRERLKVEKEILFPFHANQNDDRCVDFLREAIDELEIARVKRDYPFKWGEDFGLFTQKYPGVMFGIGSGEDCPALHNPDYDFPDELLDSASAIFYTVIRNQLM